MNKSYTIEETAKFLQTTIWTVHRRIREGSLKVFRAGGGRTYKIEHTELVRFINQNQIPMPPGLTVLNKILIVDDDEKIVRSMVRYFTANTPFEIETASTGFKAGLLIKSFKPKVIILDIMLGDINGYDVIKTIRENPEYRDIKVIAISGYIKEDEVLKLLSYGFDDYLAKPFKLSELMKRINTMFGDE